MEQMSYDPKTGLVKIKSASVALPKQRKCDLSWLLILAFFVPPFAVYLDGASESTYKAILSLWIVSLLV